MDSLKQKFGKRLKELRKSKGLTQEKIAEMVNIEPPNLSKIECGMHFPLPDKIEKIALVLGVDVCELFNFGHIKTREELINSLNNIIDNSDTKELESYLRMINLYKELK